MDSYKVEHLKNALKKMKEDEYFIPKIRVADDRYLDLDENAIKLLIDYYEKPKKELKKLVYVPDELNNNKYVLTGEYKDFGIYRQKSPSGHLISQEWLVYNGTIGFISQSYNSMCYEELEIAIDRFKENGKFGFHGFKTSVDGIYGVHPTNKSYSF